MKNIYQVSVEDFTEEISVLIQDEIVAKFQKEKNSLKIQLANGQLFYITVTEMN